MQCDIKQEPPIRLVLQRSLGSLILLLSRVQRTQWRPFLLLLCALGGEQNREGYQVWAPKQIIPTLQWEKMLLHGRRSLLISKSSCTSLGDVGLHFLGLLLPQVLHITWVSTWRETYKELSSSNVQRHFFPLLCAFFLGGGGVQNCEGYGPQNGKYLHSQGGVITNSIRAMSQLEVWANEDVCACKGWIVKDQWEKQSQSPTSPEEAYGDVLTMNDLFSKCKGLFSQCCVHWGQNKTMRGMGPNTDNIYVVGVWSLQNVSRMNKLWQVE